MQSSCKTISLASSFRRLACRAFLSLCLVFSCLAQTPQPGAAAPAFDLPDRSGVRRSLDSYRGRIVLLNFWATWCKPCRDEMPALDKIARLYAPRGVTVLGIAMDERGWAAVSPFLSQFPVTYPICLGTPRVARDYGGVRTLPFTLFIRGDGRIAATHAEAMTETQLRKAVEAMLLDSP